MTFDLIEWKHGIILEFSSSYAEKIALSRTETACQEVVYVSLKWPPPRSGLPYVAVRKSAEMMRPDIKGGGVPRDGT